MCRPGAGFRFSPVIAVIRKSVNLVCLRAGSGYLAPSTTAPAVVVYWPRVNLVQSVALFFSLYIYFFPFLFFTIYAIIIFVRSRPSLCHLYTFAQKGQHVHYAELAMRAPVYIICICTRWSAIFKGPRKPRAAKGTLIFRNYTTGRDLFFKSRRRRESRYKWTPIRPWRQVYTGRKPDVNTYNITSLYIYAINTGWRVVKE